jgi:DNA-binding IscR family transcriptional regulator
MSSGGQYGSTAMNNLSSMGSGGKVDNISERQTIQKKYDT